MARTQSEALKTAKAWVGRSYGHGWCQMWVVKEIFQSGGVGDWDGDRAADAEDGWKAAKKKVATTDPLKVPAGLPIYFLGGSHDNGHAAVSAGNGQMYSTDRPVVGQVGLVPIKSVEKPWGVKFVGYVTTDGNGHNFLDATVPPVTPTPVPADGILHGLHWNIAGSDTVNGYKRENGTRGPAVGAWAKTIGFDVFTACEASQSNLRAGINKVLGKYSPWEQRAKGIWFNPAAVKNISARKAYSDNVYAYLKTLKWGAAFFGAKGGKKFSVLEIHTDYRKPAKQAKQVQSIFKKWTKDCDKLAIPLHNRIVAGDFNPDGTSADNPFKALASWSFVEKGDTKIKTFKGGRHLDGILAHEGARVTVSRPNRWNDSGVKLSDHYPLKYAVELA